jgi:hypothetical protein
VIGGTGVDQASGVAIASSGFCIRCRHNDLA